MGAGSEIVKARIVAAAVDRQNAQRRLYKAGQEFAPTWTMRQRQRDVDQADRRLRDATDELIKTFPEEVAAQQNTHR